MRIVLLAILLLSLCTCTKFGKNVTVEGKIINPVNGTGIPDVKVQLLRSTSGIPGGYKEVKSVYTDENGEFTMDKLSLKKVYLQAQTDGNYYDLGWLLEDGSYEQTTGLYSVKKGKKTHAEFHAVPYGNLQINIKNVACFDSNDKLEIYRTHSIANLYDDVPNPAIYTGCVDQIGNMNKAPMGWYKYSGNSTKNNIVTSLRDSIYLNANETIIWDINY